MKLYGSVLGLPPNDIRRHSATAVRSKRFFLERRMQQSVITLPTSGAGLYEFTREAKHFVDHSGMETGLLTLFVRHTSCSLLIQ